MEQPLTYQQLLAEAFEENAANQLVYARETEDDQDDEVDPYDVDKYHENKLVDQEEFNKLQGDRNNPDQVIKPSPNSNEQGKSSYAYDRDIRVHSVNIDGRFREVISAPPANTCDPASANFTTGTTASDFLFLLSRQFKNVTSVKVTSVEITNSFYTFSADRENISFQIFTSLDPVGIVYTVTIDEGNYSKTEFIEEIQTKVRAASPHFSSFTTWLSPRTGRLTLSCDVDFTMNFPKTTSNFSSNGIGYNMGFYRLVTLSTTYPPNATPNPSPGKQVHFMTSDVYIDTVQDIYIYLVINDWFAIKHQYPDQTEHGAFLKLPITVPKNEIQYDNVQLDAGDKEYFFPQPVNIQLLQLSVVDTYGNTLNMQGGGFSITLAIREVLQSNIYEKMLQL